MKVVWFCAAIFLGLYILMDVGTCIDAHNAGMSYSDYEMKLKQEHLDAENKKLSQEAEERELIRQRNETVHPNP